MTNWDFKGVYDIIKNKRNPEFWHTTNSSHPGIGWNIKTVIPKNEFATNDIKCIIHDWEDLCVIHSTLVTWCDAAFDWDGNKLNEWQTIWIRAGYDVILEDVQGEGIHRFKIVNYIPGQEPILASIVDNLKLQLGRTMDKMEEEEYTNLLEIIEVLVQSNEYDVQEKRKNIKVIDNDGI
jgi:hypothetical protein